MVKINAIFYKDQGIEYNFYANTHPLHPLLNVLTNIINQSSYNLLN
jgi:hypothetical protein